MKYWIFLILLLPTFWAVSEKDACGMNQSGCMMACCAGGDGTFTENSLYGECQSNSSNGSMTSSGESYSTCVAMNCRPVFLECVAPGSICPDSFMACFTTCRTDGESAKTCDDTCFSKSGGCAAAAMAGNQQLCAPAALLSLLVLGVLKIRL